MLYLVFVVPFVILAVATALTPVVVGMWLQHREARPQTPVAATSPAVAPRPAHLAVRGDTEPVAA